MDCQHGTTRTTTDACKIEGKMEWIQKNDGCHQLYRRRSADGIRSLTAAPDSMSTALLIPWIAALPALPGLVACFWTIASPLGHYIQLPTGSLDHNLPGFVIKPADGYTSLSRTETYHDIYTWPSLAGINRRHVIVVHVVDDG